MTNSKTPTLATLAKLGSYVGKATEQTKRAFYDACAAYIGDSEGKTRTAKAEKIRNAITREGKTSPPSASTITKFAGFARRFPDLPQDVSLEVAATFAAQADEDATFKVGDVDMPLTSDADAVAVVTAYNAHLVGEGEDPLSIRRARDLFKADKATAGAPSKGDPLDVGDVVDWLLGQPKAVVAYAEANSERAAELAALLAPFAIDKAA